MRTIALLAVLIATPVFAADAPTKYVVHEFAQNAGAQDWALDAGWTWSDGALTHTPGAGKGTARQMTMPPLTAGRMYRVNVSFGGRTKGEVTVALGGTRDHSYGDNHRYNILITVNDPSQFLTFTPTNDYDGSLSAISVVELGDEIIDANGWVLSDAWTQDGSNFKHEPWAVTTLERTLPVVPGHMYLVYFGATAAPRQSGPRVTGTVALGPSKGWFDLNGGWNYAFDLQATDDNRLVFTPQDPAVPTAVFDGILSHLTVREITSDPAAPPPVVPAP